MESKERVIDRIITFSDWCRDNGLCKSRFEFERICGLSKNYIYNTSINTKSSVGSDHLQKISEAFPALSLNWVICGKGNMLTEAPPEGYITAYKKLKKKFDQLKKIINNA